MKIKQVPPQESAAAVRLIAEVFMRYEAPDYSEEGVAAFFDTALNHAAFMSQLTMYGAYQNDAIVGVIATRNEGAHIALFFVDGEHHRQGIGKKLFQVVLDNCSSDAITVNSSPYAQEVYHHLGFVDTDVEQVVTGIRFIPMSYKK